MVFLISVHMKTIRHELHSDGRHHFHLDGWPNLKSKKKIPFSIPNVAVVTRTFRPSLLLVLHRCHSRTDPSPLQLSLSAAVGIVHFSSSALILSSLSSLFHGRQAGRQTAAKWASQLLSFHHLSTSISLSTGSFICSASLVHGQFSSGEPRLLSVPVSHSSREAYFKIRWSVDLDTRTGSRWLDASMVGQRRRGFMGRDWVF